MFTVTAYRWGWTNAHRYEVYCGPDRTKALALAQAENSDRGGKYGLAVYEWDADGTDYKRIAYFGGSMNDEKAPFHNHRIDYFERLGHFLDDYGDGKAWLPNPDDPRTLKYVPVDKPPQFVLDAIDRARKLCTMMTEAEEKRDAATSNESAT